ncbi:hypothetical protein J0692_26125, partial [Vibrio alginolyticus]|nr:hypothetical protein [Vibrio alginolyticus]
MYLAFLCVFNLKNISCTQNAMVLPQWNVDANAALYVTNGKAHIQMVNDNG